MDIHKPKPWHGWREFLKVYATIVIGVLTALAAEQVPKSPAPGRERSGSAEHANSSQYLALTADLAPELAASPGPWATSTQPA